MSPGTLRAAIVAALTTALIGPCGAAAAARAGDPVAEEARLFAGGCIDGGGADGGDERGGDGGPADAAARDERSLTGVLAAAAVPALSAGMRRLGQALRRAGASTATTLVVHRNVEVGRGRRLACVQIVRGRFGEQPREVGNPIGPPARPSDDVDVPGTLDLRRLRSLGIVLIEPPSLLVELRLRRSEDGTAIALAPGLVHYGATLASPDPGRRRTRVLAAELRFRPPGVPADDPEAVGATVVLGEMTTGDTVVHGLSDGLPAAGTPESPWFPAYGSSPGRRPLTITATVAETRRMRPLLAALGDGVSASDDAIAAGLVDAFAH